MEISPRLPPHILDYTFFFQHFEASTHWILSADGFSDK